MKKYPKINWVDGMKITKDHFIYNDHVVQYALNKRLALQISDYNYGLLKQEDAKETAIKLLLSEEKLEITSCLAVTKGGSIIDIKESDKLHLLLDYRNISEHQLVCLSINDFESSGFGDPIPGETPLRHPYLKPMCNISLLPESMYQADIKMHTLIVGRLLFKSNILSLDEEFLPPCHSITAFPNLQTTYQFCIDLLSEIGKNCTEVCFKAKSKKKRGEINDLAENSFYFFEKIAFYIAEHIFSLRNSNAATSPIFLHEKLNSLARIIITCLKVFKSEDKEALLRYFESHLGIKPYQFETDLLEYCHLIYNHSKLNDFFKATIDLLSMLKTFTSKALQLEFHSIERVDVVNENVVVVNSKAKLDIF